MYLNKNEKSTKTKISKTNSPSVEGTPAITAKVIPDETRNSETINQQPANQGTKRVGLNFEEGQRFVLRKRVKLISELESFAENIKDQRKTLLEDPYEEGATYKNLGILSEFDTNFRTLAIYSVM